LQNDDEMVSLLLNNKINDFLIMILYFIPKNFIE